MVCMPALRFSMAEKLIKSSVWGLMTLLSAQIWRWFMYEISSVANVRLRGVLAYTPCPYGEHDSSAPQTPATHWPYYSLTPQKKQLPQKVFS